MAAKDLDWVWRNFGSGEILVTKHGGSKVVLTAHNDRLMVVGPLHTLVPIDANHPVAMLIQHAPQLLEAARVGVKALEAMSTSFLVEDYLHDNPGVIDEIREAIEAAGFTVDE